MGSSFLYEDVGAGKHNFGIIPLAFSPGNWPHCLPVAPVLRCSGPSSKPGSITGPLMNKLTAQGPLNTQPYPPEDPGPDPTSQKAATSPGNHLIHQCAGITPRIPWATILHTTGQWKLCNTCDPTASYDPTAPGSTQQQSDTRFGIPGSTATHGN